MTWGMWVGKPLPNHTRNEPTSSTSVGLAHRRLAILDLSSQGAQPMASADGSVCIVHNGEIFNYLELRRILEAKGHNFLSSTDTEVVLAAYREWGTDCLNYFNGMWAFAIWDCGKNLFFAARDRFGVKPFYFSNNGPGKLAFSSEIKQLKPLLEILEPNFKWCPNDKLVNEFLLTGFGNSGRETCFSGINQLLPGEYMLAQNDRLTFHRYYDLAANRHMSSSEWKQEIWQEEYEKLFVDAVRIRLRSDVPVGSCLSGGIDSSAIVVTARGLLPDSVLHTFTSRFENPKYDEWTYAQAVIKAARVDSHVVFPSLDRLWDTDLDELLWHQEEPFGSTSIYAQWKVMELAKENGLKVLLDGQGADEVLGGYSGYLPLYIASLIKEGAIHSAISAYKEMIQVGTLGGGQAAVKNAAKAALAFGGYHPRSPMENILLLDQLESKTLVPQSFVARLQYDLACALPSLLRFEDRNSMAHSIEARTPFLDFRLVEHSFLGAGKWRIERGYTKAPIRKAMRDRLPQMILNRSDKKGFVTPEADWFESRKMELESYILSADSDLGRWIQRDRLESWLKDRPWSKRGSLIWRLLVTDRWFKRFFTNQSGGLCGRQA